MPLKIYTYIIGEDTNGKMKFANKLKTVESNRRKNGTGEAMTPSVPFLRSSLYLRVLEIRRVSILDSALKDTPQLFLARPLRLLLQPGVVRSSRGHRLDRLHKSLHPVQ